MGRPPKRGRRNHEPGLYTCCTLEFVFERWPTIVMALAGAAMTWLASLADSLRPYGAVAWGGVGVLTVTFLAFAFWAGAVAYRHWTIARFEARRATVVSFNPLAGYFSHQRLALADFYHPFMQATEAAKFEDCELLGPAWVFLAGGHMRQPGFGTNCQIVVVKEGTPASGVAMFKDCVFDRCRFFNITFVMTEPMYLAWKRLEMPLPRLISGPIADEWLKSSQPEDPMKH